MGYHSSMIWAVYISVALACGVLVMMRREITSGYFRPVDYLIVTPLLYGVAVGLFFTADFLSGAMSNWPSVLLIIKSLLAFGLMVVVWGGTLTLGALMMRLLTAPFAR